jgi:CTP:molybdopterin cytidylyltransferase MocA
MQLVVLAAGHGRRFGGLKQLAPVGPNGEAIMDYTVATAASCGFSGVVVVVREEILAEVQAHAAIHFPSNIRVEFAIQGPRRGTAEAVACTAPFIDGPFAVANADDLYGTDAIAEVIAHFQQPSGRSATSDQHVLVGYQLGRTVLTDRKVTRGLINVSESGELVRIVEHGVTLQSDGTFEAAPVGHAAKSGPQEPRLLDGTEQVSMNLWGFHPRIFSALHAALDESDECTAGNTEMLLPEVIADLVASGRDHVHVVATTSRCIGITNPDDFDLVRDELAVLPEFAPRVEAPQHA